jgi:hypothetical protein
MLRAIWGGRVLVRPLWSRSIVEIFHHHHRHCSRLLLHCPVLELLQGRTGLVRLGEVRGMQVKPIR